jgi:hypothetical protein
MDRIRDYYIAQGYEKPYRWANFDEVPFTPLKKPLSESKITLFSTSDVSVQRPEGEELPAEEVTVGDVYSVDWDTPLDRLYSRQESFDRYATTLDDLNSYLPLTRLQEFVEDGRIGALTDRFHNVNRGYSQKLMLQTAAPAALEICQRDEVDVAILTPV